MASSKTKTIDEIDDIIEMAQAMAALGMSSKGLKTLDEMKNRVKDELHQSSKTPSWTAGQAFSVLSQAKDEDIRKRQVLLNLYKNAESCLYKMDETILSLLQQNMGNVEEKMNSHKFQLTHKEYFLLVAGETSSGKSSLVNLILGEELLPYSVLSTTSTICELKYGEQRKIVAHFKEKDPETGLPTKAILLKEHPTIEQHYLQQISPYVHVKSEREKGSIFKKIELFWPHSLLQKGVVIIDSPGIGQSDAMDKIVAQYIPQAFAFVYTINSANAGGVQKDRLEKFIEKVMEMSGQGQQMELSSKCALFVCNKWDQVPEDEVQAVKNHVIKKLKRCWPGLDPESQIIFMSTMKASKGQSFGFITEDFLSLMNGLRAMVLKSINSRLEMHLKWLYYLLSRVIYQAKAFVMIASRDRQEVEEKIGEVRSRLVSIKRKQNKEITALYQPILDESSRLRGELAVFAMQEVRVDDISSEYLDWKEDMSSRLGTGTFGVVYKGTMKGDGIDRDQPVPVVLKVCNFVLKPTNASDIMAEVELLRELEHPHIVKFYGTSLLKNMGTVRVIFVMEKCKENLKSRIFDHPESIPGKSENPAVAREVFRWAKQITTALNYIHEQGVVHRGLKLENILISDDNSIKVTDVGVSKLVIDITGILAGTHVYIAPEVFHSEMYGCKADIYSLGIMLWEMWYGEQAFAMVPVKTLGAFFDYLDEGKRPEHVKGCKQPPPSWKQLMNECWKRNPVERPTAKTCYEEINTLTEEHTTYTSQQQATQKKQWQMEQLLDDTESMRVCAVHDATEKGIEEEEQRWTIDQQKHERKSKRTEEKADGSGKTSHIGKKLIKGFFNFGARMFPNEMDQQEQKGVKEEQTSQKELTEMQQQELERARLHKQLREKEMSMIKMEQQLRGKDKQQQNLQRQLREMEQQLTNCHGQLRQKDEQLREKDEQLRENDEQLTEKDKQLTEKDEQLRENEEERSEIYEQLREKDEQLRDKYVELTEKDQQVKGKDEQLREKDEEQENVQQQLEEMELQLREKEQQDENLQRQLREMGRQLTNFEEQLREREEEISNLQQQNFTLESQLTNKEGEINELEMSLLTTQQAISEQRHQGTCDWVIARDEIQISEKCLGRGAWGSVYEGMYCGCTIAVKQIHELILSPHNTRLFEREMNIASRCRHPCLLQFIGATNDERSPLFVTEVMEASLRELLQQQKLSETEVAVISSDVAKAINYLHEKKPEAIIHRDVSSANVLLWRHGDQWRGKVSDYGTANFMQNTMTVAPGAMIYSAPEALTSNQTVKVDVYSFGVLLCEMNIRELPYPRRRDKQISLVTNRAFRGLIRRCLQTDPELRPSMLEIIDSLREFKVK